MVSSGEGDDRYEGNGPGHSALQVLVTRTRYSL